MTFALPSFNNRDTYRLSALMILILAFTLRVWALDARSFWFDEAHEYWAATSDLVKIPATVRIVLNDPPLYTLLLHFWIKIGKDVFTQRFLSVVISLLGVAGIMLIGRRISGRRTALVAALLMAVLPSQVRYAQDAGQYIWMSSLLVWNVFALLAICQTDKWSRYVWWIGSAWAASYIYYGAVVTVIVPVTIVFLEWLQQKDWSRMRRSALAAGVYGLGILPLILYFLPRQMFRGPTANAFIIQPQPIVQELERALSTTADLAAFQFSGWPWTGVPLWLTSLLIWPLLGLALHPHTQRTGRRMMGWLLVTWIIYYGLGYIRVYPYVYRYGLIVTPLLVPMVAQGIENLSVLPKARWSRSLLLMAILVICLLSLPNRPLRGALYSQQNWPWPETTQLESITQNWINERNRETPTYVYYGAIPAFRFYLSLFDYESNAPPATWIQECFGNRVDRAAYCEDENIYYSNWSRHLPQEYRTQELLDFVPADEDKFWMVFAHIHGNEDRLLLESLSPIYKIVQQYEDIGASIYLLQRR
jgi:hypothetical protein